MLDHGIRSYRRPTTLREPTFYVIEHPSSWRQSLSCDLNQLLTLRGF